MAGDWIKMRTDLYRDPKVCAIADELMSKDSDLSKYVNQNLQCDMSVTRNVMRNVTVGALVAVWGVLRHRGKRVGDDLLIKYCRCPVIDDISDIPGFGSAMESIGWVIECDEGIVFPNFFEEHNVDPGEEMRAKNAERQRKYREKNKEKSNVTVTSQSNAREEKRRDIYIPPISPSLLSDFLKVRKAKKAGDLTETAFKGIEREASKANLTAEQAIQICCERGWQGFKAEWVTKPQAGATSSGVVL